ncbi:MAG: helix-turn-helix domain-containing protein [Candidatus Bathyarchaeia archaeon]
MKEASYRKVSAYTKSVERYKRERERRRQVRLLAEKGFTQSQIASELGVSTRTIKRDWDKIRSYVKGQFNKEIREIVDERGREFERRYEGLTFNEELKLLKQDVKEVSKKARALQTSSRPQEQHQSQLDVTLNFDDQTPEGLPRLTVFPTQQSIRFSGEFAVKLYALKNGEKRELFNLHFSTKATSPVY